MDVPSSGFVFETCFWIEKAGDGKPALVARSVNGKTSPFPILTGDRRVLPGQKCKVRVDAASEAEVRVSYLGLSDFSLAHDIHVPPFLLKQFEALLCSGRSILLDGPQGTGKTTISRALAESLGMEFVFFNCSICFEPSDFVGSLQLVVEANGQARTEWVPTEVLTAIYAANGDPGRRYLILLDEMNRCRSYALNGIMSAIDATRRIFDPRKNCYVPIPENIQWIAAVNTGKQFSGTYKIDVAQLDRFAVLKVDYPPEHEEVHILSRRYDTVKPKLIRKVVQIANVVRRHEAIQTDLSMRATDEACMFLSYPKHFHAPSREDLVDLLTTSFCNRLPGAIREEGSEAQVARSLIEQNVIVESPTGD